MTPPSSPTRQRRSCSQPTWCLGLEALWALADTVERTRASKGVLVTTSSVGKASHDFAARHGRIQIIEGRHLKSLLAEHLGLDVLISLDA
jgi:restriction system protein